jgi:predicted helicase
MTQPARAYQKHIKAFYEERARLDAQGAIKETTVRTPFTHLLTACGNLHGWTLHTEESHKVGKRIISPDGTFRDKNFQRGHWESKDLQDDLDVEIEKKQAKGYPFSNLLFENSKRALLFQNKQLVMEADLFDPAQLTELLQHFFTYTEPYIEDFNRAVETFKDSVYRLGADLQKIIDSAHKTNKRFQATYAAFFELCRESLDPAITRARVDEMLIQHLLTDRLMRKVIDNPDFRSRNIIAAEIDKVIDAMTSASFSRDSYLRELDHFYLAIEHAAQHQPNFSDKQHFLNQVYERFFQGYSVKTADTHGIVYTPQPIVDFMCASVEEVLQTEFGKRLGDPGVVILDPCTGTGNFIVNLINRAPIATLPHFYREGLFANEIMLLPYYVAALNIEYAYMQRAGGYEAFEGLCFVDTLDLKHGIQPELFGLTEENRKRVVRQSQAPITVIIGNPPYNVGQVSENDNNKNRRYDEKHGVSGRIRETYAKDSKATLKTQLYDPYVKFFRWATDRLQGRDGIVCYVSNNSFFDQIAFDGMRKHLLQDFTQVYHIDLHGNVRQNPKLSGTTHNVFGIQVGVGVTVAVKRADHPERRLFYMRVPEDWRKEEKLDWLSNQASVKSVNWQTLVPDKKNNWRVIKNAEQFTAFVPIGLKETKGQKDTQTIFNLYSGGVLTRRDDVVYGFDVDSINERMEQFIESYNSEVDRYKRAKEGTNIDEFVKVDQIKWDVILKTYLRRQRYGDFDHQRVKSALYRPFAKKQLYVDPLFISAICLQHYFTFPLPAQQENRIIGLTDIASEKPFMALMTNEIPDWHLVGAGASTQTFPFYTYDEDGTNRRENITDWALAQFRAHYGDPSIEKWDIFYYVYGVLHSPDYRAKYAEALRKELPRIPYAPDFRAFANYETLTPYPLQERYDEGKLPPPQKDRVFDKMALNKDKTTLTVNKALTLSGIPAAAYDYKLGNRSALEWVIDQYRVKDGSDPNRADDPGYIVRLVGQVVRVSVETAEIVAGLPGIE